MRLNDISTFRAGVSLTPGITLTNGGLTNRPFVVPGVSPTAEDLEKTATTQTWYNSAAYGLRSVRRHPERGLSITATMATPNGTSAARAGDLNMSLFKEFHITGSRMCLSSALRPSSVQPPNPKPEYHHRQCEHDKVTSA